MGSLEAIILFVRLSVGFIFLVSALTKLAAPRLFVDNVLNYRLLPALAAKPYAFALPPLELAAALLLFTGFFVRWASLTVIVLLSSFILAVAVAIRRGYHLECGCFGLLYREPVGVSTIGRDVVLLLMSLLTFFRGASAPTLAQMLSQIAHPLSVIALLLISLVFSAGLVVSLLSAKGALAYSSGSGSSSS